MSSVVWNNTYSTPSSFSTLQNNDNGPANIVRLVEDPTVKKNIKFDELSVSEKIEPRGEGTYASKSSIWGTAHPVIRINDVVYGGKEISYFEIESSGIIPTAYAKITSYNKDNVKKDLPKDGDIMSVFMRPGTDCLNYIRVECVITSCFVINSSSEYTTVQIDGKMFIPKFESDDNRYALIGTSKDVCKGIAKKFGLGFAFNDPDNTDDIQNWLCLTSCVDFLNDLKTHIWKDTESYFNIWIDFFYNLCFVNVHKFLNQSTTDVDVTFRSAVEFYQGMTKDTTHGDNSTNRGDIKFFSNYTAFKRSPFFIMKWEIINNSGISMSKGYNKNSFTYENNQFLYTNNVLEDKDTQFNDLGNRSSYNMDLMDSQMILRGRSAYDPKYNDGLMMQNYNMGSLYTTETYTGMQFIMADDDAKHTKDNNTWSGNVHKNYSRAPSHNEMNFAELEKMYIEITCDGLCLQVMRGERVPVALINEDAETRESMENDNRIDVNFMYSGFYIVDSIRYTYNQDVNRDGVSQFRTIMTLKRKEWPTPEAIKSDKNETNNSNNSSNKTDNDSSTSDNTTNNNTITV